MYLLVCFFFKEKTAYEMRISDGSSDVCSSDLDRFLERFAGLDEARGRREEARRKTALTPDEDAILKFGEHNHDRVDAREIFGITASAARSAAVAIHRSLRSAGGADTVPPVPVDPVVRASTDRRLLGRPQQHGRTP